MKQSVTALVFILATGSAAYAMTVKEGDIVGKTDLVAIADMTVNGLKESVLTDGLGLSLYTFEQDSNNVSKCSGSCLTEWPPLHVPSGSSVSTPFGSIKGNDGQDQLTLNGLPLYHFAADKKPGDAFGRYPGWDAIVVEN